MRRAVKRARERHGLTQARRIGVYEKSGGKGRGKWVTVIYDLAEGTVEEVTPGNDTESLNAFYDGLDRRRLECIQAASMDMWKAHVRATADSALWSCSTSDD